MSEISPIAGHAGARGRVIISFPEVFSYDTPILQRNVKGVPEAFAERWADNTIAQLDDKFIPGWATVLETFESFHTLLVEPAVAGYPAFLAPGRTSRRGHTTDLSLALHAGHLEQAYAKMVEAIDFLVTAGRAAFEAKLQASKDIYREGATVPLSLTGDYLTQLLGAATRQWFFLNADPRVLHWKWDTDHLSEPFPPDPPFLGDGPKWDIAREHANLLVQGGCFALRQLPVAKVHADLDELLLTELREDYLPPPQSGIRFRTVDGVLTIRTFLQKVPEP